MKKSIIFLAICFLVANQLPAQPVKLSNTVLWKISGNGLTKDSYILLTGSSCNEQIKLHEKVTNAIKSVSAIAVERNLYDRDAQKLQANTIARVDSQRITNNLSTAEYQSFVQRLKDAGAPDGIINQMSAYKIGMIYYALLMTENPCEIQHSPQLYETMFKTFAAKNGLEYKVLQNVDSYIDEYNGYTNDYWCRNIRNILKNTEDTKQALKNEVDFYSSENVLGLQALYNSNPFFKLQYKDKNQQHHIQYLADKIDTQVKQESLLIAINVSNIVVKDASVFELLQQKGYALTPVN